MKVGTDGVLLGAWADVTARKAVLDMGTGTGLVALMAAQRAEKALVTAVDIDADAVRQAQENVASSPYHTRIVVLQGDVRRMFRQDSTPSFDAILCNPPYFERALHCPDEARTTARHNDTLSLDDLARTASCLLTMDGELSVIHPYDRREDMIMAAAAYGLFLTREAHVYSLPTKAPKRILLAFAREGRDAQVETLCVEDAPGHYNSEYVNLLKNFYLKF